MKQQLKNILTATLNVVKKISASLVKAQQSRADYWILTHMSDKQLKDIGTTRGEIRKAVYQNSK